MPAHLSACVREVEARLAAAARGIAPAAAEALRLYHGSRHPHLGLAVPVQRRALRQGYHFSRLPFAGRLAAWDAVWRQGRHHETKSQALMWAAAVRKPEELRALWPVVQTWVALADNWDMSDELSSVFARVLEVEPGAVYAVLERWNRARDPWRRRISILSLLYYRRSRRAVLPARKVFPLIARLLGDENRFVQKAIGWALREAAAAYPRETEAFLRRHATALSAAAFAEATRKLPALRAALKLERAKRRNAAARA